MSRFKKITLLLTAVLIVVVLGYLFYSRYLPKVVAEAIVSDAKIPGYVPKRIQKKIEKVRKPLNENAEAVIKTIHASGVTLPQLLHAIDNITEEQAYRALDELNRTKLENVEQVFDIAKKNFPVEFDVEVFRKPFNEKMSMKLVKKLVRYANRHRREQDIDPESARTIIKRILIQKEQKFNAIMKGTDKGELTQP